MDAKGTMPTPTYGAGAAACGGHIFVLGGLIDGKAVNHVECCTPR